MKSFIKTLSIALGSAVLSIFIYDFYFQPASEEIIKGNVGASLIPANYTYNSGNVAAELTDFTVAAEKTVHAVVHVKNTSSSSSDLPAFYRYFYGDDELPDRIGTGSGVIISPNGYIITNHHVIENNSEIEITTNDNKTYQATVVGSDPSSDIAVLKINTDQKLPYVFFGNSDSTKIGEWVLAVGNPFNLNSTVTAGIISAKARDLNQKDRKNEWYLQTDAAVNQGNSGGALVNTRGELIGINTAITSVSGGFVGYSFAVPSNVARKVFEDIIEFGDVQQGLLGVMGQALNSEMAERFEVKETEGFYITDLEEGLGADLAGLKPNDIIKSVDEISINKFADVKIYETIKKKSTNRFEGKADLFSYSPYFTREHNYNHLKSINSTKGLMHLLILAEKGKSSTSNVSPIQMQYLNKNTVDWRKSYHKFKKTKRPLLTGKKKKRVKLPYLSDHYKYICSEF